MPLLPAVHTHASSTLLTKSYGGRRAQIRSFTRTSASVDCSETFSSASRTWLRSAGRAAVPASNGGKFRGGVRRAAVRRWTSACGRHSGFSCHGQERPPMHHRNGTWDTGGRDRDQRGKSSSSLEPPGLWRCGEARRAATSSLSSATTSSAMASTKIPSAVLLISTGTNASQHALARRERRTTGHYINLVAALRFTHR